MAQRKSSKSTRKTSSRKSTPQRSTRSRIISFFIGVATVVIVAFLLFSLTQERDTQTVLGEKTKIEQSK